MTRTTDDHAPIGASTTPALDADTHRGAARLMRATRLLAVVMLLVLATTSWEPDWPIPRVGPLAAALVLVGWLLATNLWSRRHDDDPDTTSVTIEVASDMTLALVLTVAGGALTSRTLPMIGLLVVIEAAARLPKPRAYAFTAVFTGGVVAAVLARWPSWAGWEPQDRLAEAVPTALGLPVAALLVAGLAAERVRARQVAIGQGRRLALVARQLRDANARLEASNEELMAFAGRIAHDLRSPLGTVVTTLDTVRRTSLDLADDVRERLMEQAHRAATRSIDTVAALLDHASAEGRAPRCSLVDVRELVEEVLATLPAAELGTRTVVPPDDPALVWGDPHLLRLVVQNLVHNALAHGGEQLSRIHVVVQPGDQQIVVAVEDDGVGIATEVREAVFTAGTRNSTTDGLGLGLATCASIVGRHGGNIWIEDSVLGGAAIRFSLPWPPDERAALPRVDEMIDIPPASEHDDQRLRATTSSSGSSSRTSSAPYRPGSAPATVSTSSPAP